MLVEFFVWVPRNKRFGKKYIYNLYILLSHIIANVSEGICTNVWIGNLSLIEWSNFVSHEYLHIKIQNDRYMYVHNFFSFFFQQQTIKKINTER